MQQKLLTDLLNEYAAQRDRNHAEEQRRMDQALRSCPNLAVLLQQRQNMIFGGVRAVLQNSASPDDLPLRMDRLNRMIAAELTAAGLPENQLEPVYRCPICKDTGYTGEPIREMCSCLRAAYDARLYQQVGLRDPENQSFEHFDPSLFPTAPMEALHGASQRQMMTVFRKKTEEYANNYPDVPARDLLLTGASGLGKTFLMHCIAKRLLDRGQSVMLISAYRFLEFARKAYLGHGDEEMQALLRADVLMMDDLGSEPLMENITINSLFNLLNERRADCLGTIFSTNLSLKELRERYSERITSRLLDAQQCTVFHFVGDDVRRLR